MFSIQMKPSEITQMAKLLFQEERAINRLDGWFLARESAVRAQREHKDASEEMQAAYALTKIVEELPLSISDNALFAGTQRDAFARTYALINPAFRVETFSGYCDPTAVFGDIEPNETFTAERISTLRTLTKRSAYVSDLSAVYEDAAQDTAEVVYFIEQVTGHLIPDFRPALKYGVAYLRRELLHKLEGETDPDKRDVYTSMAQTLQAAVTLAGRYADIAREKASLAPRDAAERLYTMEQTLRKVPEFACDSLYEALQSFMLLWQVVCMEQAPNPYAFSVGNADRIFEPYRQISGETREEAAALFEHFLVFFNVADRSWAISQNVLIGGRNYGGKDLTSVSSFALLDAYFEMNLPQPILSVRLHRDTPQELYRELGRFFFTPGCLTPSLFNDDTVFPMLEKAGVAPADLVDYSIAGCQEPLIMGKDNGNTTNSWLNLPKILELTLNEGKSLITGKPIGTAVAGREPEELLRNIRTLFYQNAEHFIRKMTQAANGASCALSHLRTPFLSAFMGGMESGADLRDAQKQGTKYNGSGCLIHGLSVIADSFAAIDKFLKERPEDAPKLLYALRNNFEGDSALRDFLLSAPKFGNNIDSVDKDAVEIATRISDLVHAQRNYLGNPFRPDWSSPSTHLLYGYWVGATPDGRLAREQINYGIDPLYGEATGGLGMRILSNYKLPFEKFVGGYASHMGINPKFFRTQENAQRGEEFAKRVVNPLFFNEKNNNLSPFYLYVNVTTPETLRKVLENPKKYAPSGVYIMRIHGTFVNFLDLSPAIQQDIIARLDLESTKI